MSRSARRRKGRTYQPMPERRNRWVAQLLVVAVLVALILGSLALFATAQ